MITVALVAAIRIYQLTLSVFLGRQCRFYPTCSNYGMQAVREHGPWRGLALTGRRIGRCHPWHPGGFDPVPHARDDKTCMCDSHPNTTRI
ncbi:MAG: membrane protein insertion efficiency factor YidD [Pseudomonadales bacterium]|nr:membrane protein insertion efficiency factor YidD [Pseudomonadales bacterium]